ncbi:MAG: UPF0164 family protein [Oligoflexia bacterium]|nr:UPF0164 family protein [Oligoflexia bacterium]
MKFWVKAILAAGLIFETAQADNSFYMHQQVLSTRVQGMGGAFTALADDYNALYFNPAGLARLKEGELNFYLTGLYTPSVFDLISDIQGTGSDPVALQNKLQKYFGSHYGVRATLGGTWARPGWAIGFHPIDLTIEADVSGSAGATVGVQAFQDSTIQYGMAWNFLDNDALSVGVAPKAVYRANYEDSLTALDFVTSSQLFRPTDAQEGLALDLDFGALYTVQVPEEGWLSWLKYAKPTFAFVVRNIVDAGFKTNFKLYSKESSPVTYSKLERRFDVGSRFDLPEFWVFKPRLMIDGRDMGSRYASLRKCLHVGAELAWEAFSWLRGAYRMGLSQGYLTAGLTAELTVFRLDFATYSEEIGTASSTKESRRYMLTLGLDF